jgi:hypothetical protein
MKMMFALLITLIVTACGGSYSHYEAGAVVVMEGVVDNVVRQEIPQKKKIFSVTSVGFENGQGLNLVGIYPGISRGKRVKITAIFVENINGSDLFSVQQITASTQFDSGGAETMHLPEKLPLVDAPTSNSR